MFEKILLAYDESKEAEHALESAISLAKTLHSKLALVTVVEALPGYTVVAALVAPNLPNEMLEAKRDHLRSLQKTAVKHASDSGVTADAVLLDGEEVESIIETAKHDRADLLVIRSAKTCGVRPDQQYRPSPRATESLSPSRRQLGPWAALRMVAARQNPKVSRILGR